MSKIKTIRKDNLLHKVIFIDGQPGCGKTLFSTIISSLDKIEILNYSAEIENLCALNYLKKIDQDASMSMIKIQMDLSLYELMMSRRLNFRPNDLSSVFKNLNYKKYINRLFFKGDSLVPNIIKKEKPILHYCTHNLLAFSEPIFKSSPRKIFFIEVVRHPLYQIIQQITNHSNWMKPQGTSRQFHIYLKSSNRQFPYWGNGYQKEFLNCNSSERSILEMHLVTNLTNRIKKNKLKNYRNKILTIPFELFVINPNPYIKKITKLLSTKITNDTKKIMKIQKVPRKKLSDSINLEVYKRYGWQPPVAGYSELEELQLRKNFILKNNIRKRYLYMLNKLSKDYEDKYLNNFFHKKNK